MPFLNPLWLDPRAYCFICTCLGFSFSKIPNSHPFPAPAPTLLISCSGPASKFLAVYPAISLPEASITFTCTSFHSLFPVLLVHINHHFLRVKWCSTETRCPHLWNLWTSVFVTKFLHMRLRIWGWTDYSGGSRWAFDAIANILTREAEN